MKKNLKIAINAQIQPNSGASSLETVLRVLAEFGKLEGDEEYIFITPDSGASWLHPYLGDRQKIVRVPSVKSKTSRFENFKSLMGPFRPYARAIKQSVLSHQKPHLKVPVSDGFYESLGCDVIHFPYPDYVYCQLPTVYSPHDLQHLHYPEFFTTDEFKRREVIYPAACRAAKIVAVSSQFIKQDIISRYKIEADKVQVIPATPPEVPIHKSGKDAESIFKKYDCTFQTYMLYPAMTWEHKNHLRLLEAVALLRERDGRKVNLICTGYKHPFYERIHKRINELKLEDQVKFIGVVSVKELSLLYERSQFVVIPTLFEAASAPLFEAWQHDTAVTCSAVTSLPEQAAGAALLFNPFSVKEIASAIKKMSSDEILRNNLRLRGSQRLKNFNFERTAKAYRAVYRKAAGVSLTEEDRYLLNWDWMSDSRTASSDIKAEI